MSNDYESPDNSIDDKIVTDHHLDKQNHHRQLHTNVGESLLIEGVHKYYDNTHQPFITTLINGVINDENSNNNSTNCDINNNGTVIDCYYQTPKVRKKLIRRMQSTYDDHSIFGGSFDTMMIHDARLTSGDDTLVSGNGNCKSVDGKIRNESPLSKTTAKTYNDDIYSNIHSNHINGNMNYSFHTMANNPSQSYNGVYTYDHDYYYTDESVATNMNSHLYYKNIHSVTAGTCTRYPLYAPYSSSTIPLTYKHSSKSIANLTTNTSSSVQYYRPFDYLKRTGGSDDIFSSYSLLQQPLSINNDYHHYYHHNSIYDRPPPHHRKCHVSLFDHSIHDDYSTYHHPTYHQHHPTYHQSIYPYTSNNGSDYVKDKLINNSINFKTIAIRSPTKSRIKVNDDDDIRVFKSLNQIMPIQHFNNTHYSNDNNVIKYLPFV